VQGEDGEEFQWITSQNRGRTDFGQTQLRVGQQRQKPVMIWSVYKILHSEFLEKPQGLYYEWRLRQTSSLREKK
jgi:hypothetical protein